MRTRPIRVSGSRLSRIAVGQKFQYPGRVDFGARPTVRPGHNINLVRVEAWINSTEYETNGSKNLSTEMNSGAGLGVQRI